MLDIFLRPVKERLFMPFARALGHRVPPMLVTLAAFIAGLGAVAFAARAAPALVLGAPSAVRAPLAIAALALIGSFYVNAASWMYLSALLERRGAGARARGELTSVTMPEGLVGGTETIVFYTLFFLWPKHLVVLFLLMTALVVVTVVQRLLWAMQHLAD